MKRRFNPLFKKPGAAAAVTGIGTSISQPNQSPRSRSLRKSSGVNVVVQSRLTSASSFKWESTTFDVDQYSLFVVKAINFAGGHNFPLKARTPSSPFSKISPQYNIPNGNQWDESRVPYIYGGDFGSCGYPNYHRISHEMHSLNG